MDKQERLIHKAKRLLRRLGYPRWLHHYGPKTYELYEHMCGLLIRCFCKLSYRRAKQLCDLLDIHCPSKSALHYTAAKLGPQFWQRIVALTGHNPYVAAFDSTGFSRTNPSYHYTRRIDGKTPKVFVKLNASFDTRTKRFCAAKAKLQPMHDTQDMPYLLTRTNPTIGVADKGYSSEKLFQLADEQGIVLMIPKRAHAKRGHYRKKMYRRFRTRTYNRRQLIEAGFSSVKRKFGGSVSAKKALTIRAEVYGKLACHNIFGKLQRLLGQSRMYTQIFKYINHYLKAWQISIRKKCQNSLPKQTSR